MILHCPACRALVEVARARVAEGGAKVGLRCAECGETSWLPTEGPDAPGDGAPEDAAQAAGPARAAPGSRASGEPVRLVSPELVAALKALPADSPEEQELAEAFSALLGGAWEDRSRHQALLKRASALGALPTLGVRYRKVLERSSDDAMARWGQQEIVNLAMASLATLASGPSAEEVEQRARQRAALVALGLSLCGFVLVLLFFFYFWWM